MSTNLKVGDEVEKTSGDYYFTGIIVAKFNKLSGKERYVVENKDGVLHIFNVEQLTKYDILKEVSTKDY